MAMADMAKNKGDSLMNEAKKKLGGFNWFGFSGSKFESAAELYSQAGAQYKIARAWTDAAKAYEEYADISLNKLSSRSDAAQGLSEAGRAWRNENTTKAVQCLKQAATILMEDNRFSPSAKLWVEVAEIYTSDLDRFNAIDAYTQAAECYKAANSKITSQSMFIKAADLMALEGRYNDAIKIYEDVAESQADASTVSFSICGYYYKALLCKMVAESNTGCDELMDTEEKLMRYCDVQPRMQDSKEANLVRSLVAAYGKTDPDAFTQALSKYDSIYRLDQWSSELLYKVKKNLMGEGEVLQSKKAEDYDELK